MTKLSKAHLLGPVRWLLTALAFPLCYGLWELVKEKKYNIYSIIGLVSIALTGGIGLFHIPTQWVAIKEAGVPTLFGILVLWSIWLKHPLVKGMVGMMLDMDAIDAALQEKPHYHDHKRLLDRLETSLSYWIAVSFFVSAILNFLLAKWIVHSPAGTEAFTEEIGKMTGLSFPVIVLPVTLFLTIVLVYVVRKMHKLTGLEFEDMMKKN